MRVAMLVRCLGMMRGGGETRHLAWARELRALGVEVELIAGLPMVGEAKCGTDNERVRYLRSPYLRDFVYRVQNQRGFGRASSWLLHLDDRWFVDAAWRYLARVSAPPDVVHAHALHEAASRRRLNVPVVINLPGVPHRRYAGALRAADALVSDGWGAAHLPRELGMPVDDVPKGVDTARFTLDGENVRQTIGALENAIVLTVARLVPIKNVSLLLDAFSRVAAAVPRALLVVVGDGPQRTQLEQKAAGTGLAQRVRFAGSIPHEELPWWYRAAAVFALTSTFDNSPNVVLEAMACGVPVVATDVGGVSRFVTPGRNGVLVQPTDVDGLANAIITLINDRPRASAIGRQNRADVAKGFSWRASAERLLAVYERVLERHSVPRRTRRVAHA